MVALWIKALQRCIGQREPFLLKEFRFEVEKSWGKNMYLFVVDVSIAAKSCFDMFSPFSLPLRVFLSPQGVYVMREQGSGGVGGVSQTAAGHPRLQAARRRGTTCVQNIIQLL